MLVTVKSYLIPRLRVLRLLLTKINAGLLRTYASMPQCAKIILGGSHDNGYARVLSQLEAENVVPGKVMLLKGPPFAAELDSLTTSTFPRLEFGGLFMTTKLEPGKSLNYV
jgi:hypothetical protein